MLPPPPRSTLFPYTTLFRSLIAALSSLLFHHHTLLTTAALITALLLPNSCHGLAAVLAALPLLCFLHRSEEHTSELQSLRHLVCRLLLEKKNIHYFSIYHIL